MSSSKIIGCGLLFVMCFISASMAQDELQDMQPTNDQAELLKSVQGLLSVLQTMLGPDNDTVSEKANVACRCGGLSCSCCQHINVRKMKFNKHCCLTVMYLKRNVGFLTTLRCGSKQYFSKEVSLRNPLPICVGVPYIVKAGSICIQLNDLRANKRSVHGCATLLGRLLFVTVAKVRMGCFNMHYMDQAAAQLPESAPELPSYDDAYSWIGTQQDSAEMPVFEDDMVMMENIGQPL